MTPRLPRDDRRAAEAVKHLAATLEHVGRMLHAIEQGNWDGARDRMSDVSMHVSIANVRLNVGYPDGPHTLAGVREQLPKQWADTIAAFLVGGEAGS